jgi:hypothetical protein
VLKATKEAYNLLQDKVGITKGSITNAGHRAIEKLISLRGVGIALASHILALMNDEFPIMSDEALLQFVGEREKDSGVYAAAILKNTTETGKDSPKDSEAPASKSQTAKRSAADRRTNVKRVKK